jgi:type I restriction enzyme S subunit
MNAQDLKNSILQLAIQGKLVEQRKEEGTAKELIQRIEAEKKQLIKEGKIKKQKALPEIKEDEIPFDIPESWEWTRMSSIADMYTGNSIPKSIKENKYSNVENGYDYIGTKDVGFDYTVSYDNGIKIPFEEDKFKKSFKDSILMCIEGGSAGRKIGILDKTVCFGNKLCSFNLIYGEPRFLYYYLQSPLFFQAFRDEMTGIIGGVSISKLKGIIVPLPPLEEQKRIVAKIEELMPYVDKYDVAYSEVEELNKKFPEDMQKSILQYAIQGKLVEQREEDGTAEDLYQQIQEEKKKLIKEGKIKKTKALPEITEDEIPFDIPENWKWVRLGDISNNIHYGYTASAQEKGNSKLLRITDIQNNSVNWNSVPFCNVKNNEFEKYGLNNRDIMIARTGGTIGKTYIVDSLDDKAVFASYLIRVIPVENINEVFLKKFMESPLYWTQLKSGSIGTGQPNVNGKTLSKLLLPLPPLKEQKRIVAKVEELIPRCKQLYK